MTKEKSRVDRWTEFYVTHYWVSGLVYDVGYIIAAYLDDWEGGSD